MERQKSPAEWVCNCIRSWSAHSFPCPPQMDHICKLVSNDSSLTQRTLDDIDLLGFVFLLTQCPPCIPGQKYNMVCWEKPFKRGLASLQLYISIYGHIHTHCHVILPSAISKVCSYALITVYLQHNFKRFSWQVSSSHKIKYGSYGHWPMYFYGDCEAMGANPSHGMK